MPLKSSSFYLFQGSSNIHQLALILAAKGNPTREQMKSINPIWKEAIQSNPALPDFFRRVLSEDTPEEAIDLIS